MGDVLVIISKAQFEAEHRSAKVGDACGFTKYVSTHAALEPVRGGGSLFLVTVRPPDEQLWLVAELSDPKHDGKAWVSPASSLRVRDVTPLIPRLKFVNGKGLAPKKGALGMSLQTPRALTAEDVALLRGEGQAQAAPTKPKADKPEPKKSVPVTPAPAVELTELSLEGALTAWRTTRAPELEELISVLGRHRARASQPLDPEADDYDAQWTARANTASADDLDHLLPGLWSDPRGSIPMRVRKLLDLGPDPRLGEAFLKMVDEPPLTASSQFSAWTTLFKALPSLVDTRAVERLQARTKKKGGDSQFWPKLNGWIAAAIDELPEPAVLSKEQAASVKRQLVEAKALLKGAPPSLPAARRERPGAAPMTGSPRDALQTALDALHRSTVADALEPLRQYWQVTGSTRAAELITSVARLTGGPDFSQGKPKDLHAHWMKAARAVDAKQVTPLLDAVLAGALTDAEERLEQMLRWPPDPRVAEAMLDRVVFGREPHIGARPQLFKRAYDLLVRNADPRFTQKVQENATRLEKSAPRDRVRAERPHASRTVVAYVNAASAGREPSADEATLLSALESAVAATREKVSTSKKPDQELALLLAINAAPDDVTPYLVYADFLAERGDARAEFINLCVALEQGKPVKGKIEAWKKANLALWCGRVPPFKAMHRERRGVMVSATLDWYRGVAPKDIGPMTEDLRWVSVRDLSFRFSAGQLIAGANEVLTRAPLHGLTTVHGVTGEQLALMAARDFDWRVECIELAQMSLPAGLRATRFPRLTQVELPMYDKVTREALAHPFFESVKHFCLGSGRGGGHVPLEVLVEGLLAQKRFETLTVRFADYFADVTRVGNQVELTLRPGSFVEVELSRNARPNLESLKQLPAQLVKRCVVADRAEGEEPASAETTKAFAAWVAHLPR